MVGEGLSGVDVQDFPALDGGMQGEMVPMGVPGGEPMIDSSGGQMMYPEGYVQGNGMSMDQPMEFQDPQY